MKAEGMSTDRAKRYAANRPNENTDSLLPRPSQPRRIAGTPSNADIYGQGDLVEVLHAGTGVWMAATVTRFWRGMTGAGEPANQIDADGVDADGPFYGRFD